MSPTAFTSLPREVRDIVYNMALTNKYEMRPDPHHCAMANDPDIILPSPECWNLLSIEASNLVIATEAREAFFGGNELVFNTVPSFEKFISATVLRKSAIFNIQSFLREVRFYLSLGGLMEALRELAALVRWLRSCPKLRRVSIIIKFGTMARYHQCEAILALRQMAICLKRLEGLMDIDCGIEVLCMLVGPCDKARGQANLYVDWDGTTFMDAAEGLLKGADLGLPSLLDGCSCGKLR